MLLYSFLSKIVNTQVTTLMNEWQNAKIRLLMHDFQEILVTWSGFFYEFKVFSYSLYTIGIGGIHKLR